MAESMSGLRKSQVETLRAVQATQLNAGYATPAQVWRLLCTSLEATEEQLRSLRREGLVEKCFQPAKRPPGVANAPGRTYYVLTPTGKEALAAASAEPGGGKQ